MMIVVSTLAVAFAAFCVWLTVRIVNRKERWAKRTAAGVLGVPVLYVLSFGPLCWVTSQSYSSGPPQRTLILYWPLGKLADDNNSATASALRRWILLGIPQGKHTVVPTSATTWTKYTRR
ncbi:MAG: hypothetical protein HY290_26615 [Planctomycetia bacterium]|nr:hypothetical protein [Planctomycetia bacterium]